jgi:dTDP-glucose pyrophosphorylase
LTVAEQLVGLVPAAGYATRLQPMASSKETLRVGGRPLMCHLVERMRRAGCSTIRVTTRPEKNDVVELAEREGIEVVLAQPSSVSESLLVALDDLPDEAIALVGFPDTIWEPADAYGVLVDLVRAGEELVLGLFEVAQPERCDVVEVSGSGVVRRIVVKPRRPRTNVTWGIFAARIRILRDLAEYAEPGDYFDRLAHSRTVRGVLLTGPYEDAGTPEVLARLLGDRPYDEVSRRDGPPA